MAPSRRDVEDRVEHLVQIGRQGPADPYDSPGTADLTAHVNFHSLANVARTRLLSVHGPVDQGQWLKALGIDQRMAKLALNSPDKAGAIRSAHRRLTSIDEMGRYDQRVDFEVDSLADAIPADLESMP